MAVICDRLSVSQVHPGGLPVIGSGTETRVDFASGDVRERTLPLDVYGDFGSHMRVMCDGSRVSVDGNIGAWNRPHNVDGYGLEDCKVLLNEFLASFDLPPFSAGQFVQLSSGLTYTGATFSRIDSALTAEFDEYGSRWFYAMQHKTFPRLKKAVIDSTIYHGYRSKSRLYRIYDKASEYKAKAGDFFDPDYFSLLRDSGVYRVERQARRVFLSRNNLRAWHTATDAVLVPKFLKEVSPFMEAFDFADLDSVPTKYLGTLLMAMGGIDPKDRLSKNTYYAHKRALAKLGYDISLGNLARIKVEVVKFKPRIRPALTIDKRSRLKVVD